MIEARDHLAAHPDCELCTPDGFTTPAISVGVIEHPDTAAVWVFRSVCETHRVMVQIAPVTD